MDDLISRQEAIYAVNTALFPKINTAKDAEKALRNLPPAQPETHEERTETHACDLISRQAAIDALMPIYKSASLRNRNVFSTARKCMTAIEALPSAQPEIIRCNDCKHWTQTTGNMRGFGLGDCDYINAKLVNCNGFCYWAERREE